MAAEQVEGMGGLPDFVIIGAQKAGTTTLFDYLSRHPSVIPSTRKEVHYFTRRFTKGEAWYRSHFPGTPRRWAESIKRGRRVISGEATPLYLYHPLAAERMAALVPGVKLIAILRDPVSRAYSNYHHEVEKGRETLSFEDALAAEEERIAGEEERIRADAAYDPFAFIHFSYRARGRYAEQLERMQRHHRAGDLLVVESGEFRRNPDGVTDRVCAFLGIPAWRGASREPLNAGRYAPMAEGTRRELSRYYAEHNERLYALLGERYEWA